MLATINWNPPAKVLRQFGWICAFFFPLIAWMFSGRPGWSAIWSDQAIPTGLGPWVPTLYGLVIGLAIAIGGMISPKSVKPIFLGLSLLTFPIGLIMGELIMLITFFLVFTTVGLIFKLIGRDSMTRRFEPDRASYWEPKAQAASVRRYYQQY